MTLSLVLTREGLSFGDICARQIENIREQIPFLDDTLDKLAQELLPSQHCHQRYPKMDLEIIVIRDGRGEVSELYCDTSTSETSRLCQDLIENTCRSIKS